MRTLIIAAAALLIAGSAFAQSSEGGSKTRRDLQPQAVPQSSGTAHAPSTGSKTRKDEKSDPTAQKSGSGGGQMPSRSNTLHAHKPPPQHPPQAAPRRGAASSPGRATSHACAAPASPAGFFNRRG